MRMFLLILALLIPSISQADSLNLSTLISGLKFDEGVAWDFKNKQMESTSTVVLFEYAPDTVPTNKFLQYLSKADPSVNVGYSTADKAVVGLSVSLGSLSDLGVKVPLLKLISFQPTIYYSFYHINLSNIAATKNSWLLGAKILDIKF